MNRAIFAILRLILDLNAKLYDRAASHEVCRDLAGRYNGAKN